MVALTPFPLVVHSWIHQRGGIVSQHHILLLHLQCCTVHRLSGRVRWLRSLRQRRGECCYLEVYYVYSVATARMGCSRHVHRVDTVSLRREGCFSFNVVLCYSIPSAGDVAQPNMDPPNMLLAECRPSCWSARPLILISRTPPSLRARRGPSVSQAYGVVS